MRTEGTTGGSLERFLDGPPTISGPVFVYAARGLRRLHGRGEGFFGYSAGEMFWKDVLGFVHEDDLPRARTMISDAVESPGITLTATILLRDKAGEWRPAEFTVTNVVEALGDPGLVVADVNAG